ncbi:MAG: hypothetical protein ACKN9F_01910, partial [Methylomonas sp.]
QQSQQENLCVLYLPNFNEAVLLVLEPLLAACANAVIYSWQPGLLRNHFIDERLSFLPIPQFLVDKFGNGSKT